MVRPDERTELMNAISDLLGIPHDPKGVGSSVHNSWVNPVCVAAGLNPSAYKNKYRRLEALLQLYGEAYDPFVDTSEYSATGGGTITNLGLAKLERAIRREQIRARTEATEPPEPPEAPAVDAIADARRRVLREIALRRGQAGFRQALVTAYNSRCAVTDCDAEPALEAAHIAPYRGDHTNVVTNGLLLRADIHTLFDLGRLGINPDAGHTVVLAPALRSTSYGPLHGSTAHLPTRADARPSTALLRRHGSLYALW